MSLNNICIFILLIDFVLFLGIIRYWSYYNKHKKDYLTPEERLIYRPQIKPLKKLLKQCLGKTK